MAEKYSYWATSLIGGAEGSLDSIDGTDLNDQDMAIVAVMGDKFYLYSLDADSAAAESSPDVIAPDANGGDKRWTLQSIHSKIDGIDLNGGTDIGADLADEDLILVDDGAGGTNRKAALSRLKTYIGVGIALFFVLNMVTPVDTEIVSSWEGISFTSWS